MKQIPRKSLVAVLAAMLLIAALAWVLWPAPGPRYAGKPLRHWLVALASGDYRVRLQAEAALKNLGPEAVPELTRAVSQRETLTGGLWRALCEGLLTFVKLPPSCEEIAAVAAGQLARLGSAAAPASRALVTLRVRGGYESGKMAESALKSIGPTALPAIERILQRTNTSDAVKQTALRLAQMAGKETAFGPSVTNFLPRVMALSQDPEWSVRVFAAGALGSLGQHSTSAWAHLTAMLSDTNEQVRVNVAGWLGEIGTAAGPAAETRLRAWLENGSAREQLAAAEALWFIARETNRTVQVLAKLLDDSGRRERATVTLARIGPAAQAAVTKLVEILQTEQTHRPSRTPSMTAIALGQIGAAAVPALVPLLESNNADVRMNAAAALRGIGPAAAPAVPSLIRMLRAEDLEEQMAAANALAAIGPAAKDAVPELTRLSRLETTQDVIVGHVRSAAKDALEKIVPANNTATDSEPLAPRTPPP